MLAFLFIILLFHVAVLIIIDIVSRFYLMLVAKKFKMKNRYLVWVPLVHYYLWGDVIAKIRGVGSGVKWLFFSLPCFSVIFVYCELQYFTTSILAIANSNQQNTFLLSIIICILLLINTVITILFFIQLGLSLKVCGYSTITIVLVILFIPLLWSFLVWNRIDDLLQQRECEQTRLKQQ